MFKKKNLIVTIFAFLLLAFTIYVISDTFLITRVYSSVMADATQRSDDVPEVSSGSSDDKAAEDASGDEGSKASASSSGSESSEPSKGSKDQKSSSTSNDTNTSEESSAGSSKTVETISSDTQYQDENISVNLTEYNVNDTVIYVADVQVSSAEYLKTALAQNAYGRNVTDETSDIAEGVGAILAINGDYYGSQERGYVLRNGVLYRNIAENGQEDLVIYEDGSFDIITETEISAEELLANGAVQILSFGPALVEDGSISVSVNDEVGKAKSSNPRTAIGIIDDLHYVFVVSDGRTNESEGLSLYELAQFMESLGVSTAYNLDGGGSSTIYYNGQVINNPTTNGNSIKERKVSDIVYIGY